MVTINNFIKELLNSKELTNVEEFEDAVNQSLVQIHKLYLTSNTEISADCIVFNHLHDAFMPMVHKEFEDSDQSYFQKSLELTDMTAEQLGAPIEYTVSLLAAIVELANLDNHKSPLEKMHCLCTAYDFIFAELKAAVINTISKSSSREYEIPTINNSDVIPILITVIVKSKLPHLYSNFYYITAFGGRLNELDYFKHVLKAFEQAVIKLNGLSKDSLKPRCVELYQEMDLPKFIYVTNKIYDKINHNIDEMTPLDNQLYEKAELIVTSTNENQLLPNE
ncbi:hypothetical protein FQA39_LY16549 [Lamprigera yunnana]|nr:hypothetical protein FQA39_LY16549 [Lamprigera yunnana]